MQLKIKEFKAPKLIEHVHNSHSVQDSLCSHCGLLSLLQIHLSGMVFDEDLEKCIKKRHIPPSEFITFPSALYTLSSKKEGRCFLLVGQIVSVLLTVVVCLTT